MQKKDVPVDNQEEMSQMLSPAKKLAYDLSEIDKKFNAAFEALRNSMGISDYIDFMYGYRAEFRRSFEELIEELETAQYVIRSEAIRATTIPYDYENLIELLEYISKQAKESDEDEWDDLHLGVYDQAVMMADNDESMLEHIKLYMPESLKSDVEPIKESGFCRFGTKYLDNRL